jgi:elongation factor Ts
MSTRRWGWSIHRPLEKILNLGVLIDTMFPSVMLNFGSRRALTLLTSVPQFSRFTTAAAVPIATISELRKSTGASIQKCKEALEKSNHDIATAIEFLRKRGESINQKPSSAESAGSKVSASVSDDFKSLVVTKTTSLTDFASASELFVRFSECLARELLESDTSDQLSLNGAEISPLLHGTTLEEVISEMSTVLAEPVKIAETERISADVIGYYVHGRSPYSAHVGSSVSVVAASLPTSVLSSKQLAETIQLVNKIARQVMATRPQYVASTDVPEAIIEKERSVMAHKVTNPNALERALKGHMKKFHAESCLMDMDWIIPDSNTEEAVPLSVQDYVETECKRIGLHPSQFKIARFVIVK